jgi:hypothetical protein
LLQRGASGRIERAEPLAINETAYIATNVFLPDRASERFDAQQRSLLQDTLDADLAALEEELQQLSDGDKPEPKTPRSQPRRAPLPPQLPRVEIHHEPESELCGCGCRMMRIGEDVAEKPDYQTGVFTVARSNWRCEPRSAR